ncbi:Abi family protein [Capnocytophaga stomatis]|uniref:Abi family protein n=1 Tax=Capnocytophaga stomatis TaxID=1848904 RepID=UPI003858BE53
MGNVAHSVEEQIEKLKRRGMIFCEGEEKAKEQLLDIGYYRLGFYWYYFEKGIGHKKHKNRSHIFQDNTRFSDVIELYYLDIDLKHLLTKIIGRIEVNFRTKVIYHVSNEYKTKPAWYADGEVLEQSFIDELPKYYNDKFKETNKPLKKYIGNIDAPAWKVLEFFTFGNILHIYKKLKSTPLKRKIASEYGIKSVYTCVNFFNTIRCIRNICAHNGILYDSNMPTEIHSNSLVHFNNNNRHSLDSSIKVILYILGTISQTRKNEYEKEIKKLFDKYKENEKIRNIIEKRIGYVFDIKKK